MLMYDRTVWYVGHRVKLVTFRRATVPAYLGHIPEKADGKVNNDALLIYMHIWCACVFVSKAHIIIKSSGQEWLPAFASILGQVFYLPVTSSFQLYLDHVF